MSGRGRSGSFTSSWWYRWNGWWHRWMVKRQGRRDGKKGIPGGEEMMPSLFENRLISQGKQLLDQIQEDYGDRIQKSEGQFNAAVERLRWNVDRFKPTLRRYHEKQHHLRRGVTIHIPKFWYFVFLILIVIGELALNFQAFQVFQKPLILTFVMAMAVAVGLPTSAHFIGIFLKQWPKPVWRTAIYTFVAMAVGVVCLSGINIARSEYLNLMDIDLMASDKVLQNAFLMINLFIFATAILVSLFAHDSDQDFENLHNNVEVLDRQCRKTSDEVLRKAGQIDALTVAREAEVRLVQSICEEVVYLYRGANQQYRKDPSLPKSFEAPPNLPPPKEIEEVQKMVPLEEVKSILKVWSSAHETGLLTLQREEANP